MQLFVVMYYLRFEKASFNGPITQKVECNYRILSKNNQLSCCKKSTYQKILSYFMSNFIINMFSMYKLSRKI